MMDLDEPSPDSDKWAQDLAASLPHIIAPWSPPSDRSADSPDTRDSSIEPYPHNPYKTPDYALAFAVCPPTPSAASPDDAPTPASTFEGHSPTPPPYDGPDIYAHLPRFVDKETGAVFPPRPLFPPKSGISKTDPKYRSPPRAVIKHEEVQIKEEEFDGDETWADAPYDTPSPPEKPASPRSLSPPPALVYPADAPDLPFAVSPRQLPAALPDLATTETEVVYWVHPTLNLQMSEYEASLWHPYDGHPASAMSLTCAEPNLGPVKITSNKNVHLYHELKATRNLDGGYYPPAAPAVMDAVAEPGLPLRDRKPHHYCYGDFEWTRTLGTGTFGRVHLVQSKHNGRFFAVKVLNKAKVLATAQVEHTNQERQLLLAVSRVSASASSHQRGGGRYNSTEVGNPFVVNLWGTWQDPANVYMVMDYVGGGELFSLLRRATVFPASVARFYAAEVVLALAYLHGMDIIYRDLKPENILLTMTGHIKLTDFGFAKHVPDITFTLCGTPDYLAPELVQHLPYTKSVDWYSLGVLVYEMLAGHAPFIPATPSHKDLYDMILHYPVQFPAQVGAVERAFLNRTMTRDLSVRYGHAQTTAPGEGQGPAAGGIMHMNTGRQSAEDVMRDPFFIGVEWELLEASAAGYFGDGGGGVRPPWLPTQELDDMMGEGQLFEWYGENDFEHEYQAAGFDEHGHLFPDF